MHRPSKKNMAGGFSRKFGADFWVEMKNDGLKTGAKPGLS